MGDTKPTPESEPSIPKAVLHQLNEHTIGGFALFFFHPETGFPQHILNFDSPAHCLAMQKYMADWNAALQSLYMEGAKASIKESFGPAPED